MVGAFFALDLGRFLTLAEIKRHQAELSALFDARPLLVVVSYFSVYVTVAALSLPGAALLTLLGGAIFGLGWGTLIVSFASSIGATLAFLASRFLLRDAVKARFAEKLEVVDRGVRKEGGYYLFTLRLVPVFPFFLVNLVMGLTSIPTRTFYWVSQAGMLLGTLVYVNVGTQLSKVESLKGVLDPVLIASFVLMITFSEFRRERIFAYLNPWDDKYAQGKAYQLTHSLIAFGRGEVRPGCRRSRARPR